MELPNGRKKNWSPTKNSRICSVHFIDGKNTYPTKHLGDAGKFSKPVKLRKPPSDISVPDTPSTSLDQESMDFEHQINVGNLTKDHAYAIKCACECHHNCPQSCMCKCHVASSCTCCTKVKALKVADVLEQTNFDEVDIPLDTERSSSKSKMEIMSLLKNDERLKLYTGLKSKACFDDLHSLAVKQGADRMRYWRGEKRIRPTTRDFKATPKTGTNKEIVY